MFDEPVEHRPRLKKGVERGREGIQRGVGVIVAEGRGERGGVDAEA